MRGIRVSHRDFSYFGHHFSHDPINIFALVLSSFVAGNIVWRSPIKTDRFVFGGFFFSLALSAIIQLVSFGSASLWAMRAADAVIWTVAAAICAATLAGWNKQDQEAVSSD